MSQAQELAQLGSVTTVDANGAVSIAHTSTAVKGAFNLSGNYNGASGGGYALNVTNASGSSANAPPSLGFFKSRGTPSVNTNTLSGDQLAVIWAAGYNSTPPSAGDPYGYSYITFTQSGAPTAGGNPTDIVFLPNDGVAQYGTERARITATGELKFNSGYGSVATAYGCRAWVNFNGTNGTIRGSGNVSSVTRTSTGVYTVNFTSALPDANYSVSAFANFTATTPNGLVSGTSTWAPSTTSCELRAINSTSTTVIDPSYVLAQFVR